MSSVLLMFLINQIHEMCRKSQINLTLKKQTGNLCQFQINLETLRCSWSCLLCIYNVFPAGLRALNFVTCPV